MRPIARDTSDFPDLRKRGCIYVDKTAWFRRLLTDPGAKCFFLARPRRFGKHRRTAGVRPCGEGTNPCFPCKKPARMGNMEMTGVNNAKEETPMIPNKTHSSIGKIAALFAALFLFVGQAAAAEHNPVIFLHGWRGDDTVWFNMTNLLIGAGWSQSDLYPLDYFRGVNITVSNYAERVYSGTVGLERGKGNVFPKNIAQIMDDPKYAGKKFDFVCHSMGGLVLRKLILSEPRVAKRIGVVVDLATPHYGQHQDVGKAAEDMVYGSSLLWELQEAWASGNRIEHWLSVAGVSKTGSSTHDGLVDQWSANLIGTDIRYVDKCHSDGMIGQTIYACGGADSGNGFSLTGFGTGDPDDPVFRIVKGYLESGGNINKIPSQSECGANVPRDEGGGIFLQVVKDGKPLSWNGNMVVRVMKPDGTAVNFYQHYGDTGHLFDWRWGGQSYRQGIVMLTDTRGTYRGFDPGIYDIEFLPSPGIHVGPFTIRGIKVESNRVTIEKVVPPSRIMIGICIDCSGSMQGERIANAIASAQRTVDSLPAGTFVEILRFADSASVVQSFVEIKDNADGTSNRGNIKVLIGRLSASGGTDILEAGYKMLTDIQNADAGKTAVRNMILLTDGEDSNFQADKASFIRACNEAGVSFNAIAYGSAADAECLSDVANGTRGSHFESGDSATELDKAFERTVSDILNKSTIVDWDGTFEELSNPTTTGQGVRRSKTILVDSSEESIYAVSTVPLGYTVILRDSTGRTYSGTVRQDENGRTYTFEVPHPTRGTWSLDFVKASTASVDGRISILVTTPTPTTESAPSLSLTVHSAENAVRATLKNGGLVRGAIVSARCRVNDLPMNIPMSEVSPGVYWLDLLACGDFEGGLVVSAEAVAGTATVVETDETGTVITPLRVSALSESFSRARFLNLSKIGDGAIRSVSVHPRWPWEGQVDIDFEAATIDMNTVLSVGLSGMNSDTGDAYAVQSVTCDESLARISPGKHRITWNAAADVPDADIENFSVRFDATTAKALEDATGVTATQGTRLDGVYVSWNAVPFATHYRVYRTEANSSGAGKTFLCETSNCHYLDSGGTNVGPSLPGGELPVIPYTPISLASTMLASGDSLALASGPAILAANSVTSGSANAHYRYWIQPIAKTSAGTIKHEGGLAMSNEGWKGTLGAVSGLSASAGTHYDGVHLSWTGPTGATQYKIYRSTSSSGSKTLLTTTTSTSFVDSNTTASQSPNRYYYWVEPIAVVSSVTYVGTLSSSVSGWRNKLGTPSFHFENWRPGHKNRPDIDLYIDGSVAGATRYEFMSGDKSAWWTKMDKVVNGKLAYGSYDGGKGSISNSASPKKATIGWAWAYRYDLKVYVRAANSEGAGDWVKWNLADHLKESAFKNSEFYKTYPKK